MNDQMKSLGHAVLVILALIGAGAIFLFVSCLAMVSQIH
jgi:hypothetical protein